MYVLILNITINDAPKVAILQSNKNIRFTNYYAIESPL